MYPGGSGVLFCEEKKEMKKGKSSAKEVEQITKPIADETEKRLIKKIKKT